MREKVSIVIENVKRFNGIDVRAESGKSFNPKFIESPFSKRAH